MRWKFMTVEIRQKLQKNLNSDPLCFVHFFRVKDTMHLSTRHHETNRDTEAVSCVIVTAKNRTVTRDRRWGSPPRLPRVLLSEKKSWTRRMLRVDHFPVSSGSPILHEWWKSSRSARELENERKRNQQALNHRRQSHRLVKAIELFLCWTNWFTILLSSIQYFVRQIQMNDRGHKKDRIIPWISDHFCIRPTISLSLFFSQSQFWQKNGIGQLSFGVKDDVWFIICLTVNILPWILWVCERAIGSDLKPHTSRNSLYLSLTLGPRNEKISSIRKSRLNEFFFNTQVN